MSSEETKDKKDVLENVEQKNNKFNFKNFIKKNGFFLGLILLILIAATVLVFDANKVLKGDIPYDDTVYLIGNNTISMVKYNKEPIVISPAIFQSDEGKKIGVSAHEGIIISDDQEKLIYVDNIASIKADPDASTGGKLVGDLKVFDGVSNILIAENADFSFVVSDDFSTVAFRVFSIDQENKVLRSDLYTYNVLTKEKTLIQENLDSNNYSLSNDGKVCVYLHDLVAAPDEKHMDVYSLYLFKDGQRALISKDVHTLESFVVTGTAYSNYPLINKQGDKIIYSVVNYVDIERQSEEELDEEDRFIKYPTFDMYIYENGKSELLAKSCSQLLVSYDYTQVVFVSDVIDHLPLFDTHGFGGTCYHYDVKSKTKTMVDDNVFGFIERNIVGFVDNELIDANFYFKKYDALSNTANLYKKLGDKFILIDREASVGGDWDKAIDFVFFSPDYKDIYVFKSYVEKSTILYKYTMKSNGSFTEYVCEDVYPIDAIKLSKDGSNLVYKTDGRLVVISKNNIKKTIERTGASSFGITQNGRFVYYYKEASLGVGALYYYDLEKGDSSVKFLNNVNEVWNYKDNLVFFRNNTDYSTLTGDLYLTDFKEFEFMSENVYSQINYKVKIKWVKVQH